MTKQSFVRRGASLLLLFAWTSSVATDASLGRLFFAPERRLQLDHQRELNQQQTREISEDPAFTINGVVVRSSGLRTVWVDGAAQHDTNSLPGLSLIPKRGSPSEVTVTAGSMPTTSANVGTTIIRSTGETSDALNGGSITIRRQRRAP